MNTVHRLPQSSELASPSLNFVDFTSTGSNRPQPAPTHASYIRTAVLSAVNTVSLITDPIVGPEPLTSKPSAPTSTTGVPAVGQSSSHNSRASSVLIIIITLPVAVTLILGVLLAWCLIRRRRRRRAEPAPCRRPNVLRRPRRLSDFWSADASKPESRSASALAMIMATTPTTAQHSPSTPNENAGLLRQDGAIRRLSRSMELIIAAGLAGDANARNSGLAPNVGVDRHATESNDIQQPVAAYYPERLISNRNADVEQQQVVDLPGTVQPPIPEPYSREPRSSTRRVANPISPPMLPSPLHGAISGPSPEQTLEPAPPSRPSPPPARREFSDLTFTSIEFFDPDDRLVFGPATQSSHVLSHFESPTQLSILSSAEPRPSTSSSHPPHALQLIPQPDVSQALETLRRPVSRSTYRQRTSSKSSTIGTVSTTHKLQLNMILASPSHPPNASAPGYFTHASPKSDILEGPQLPRPSPEIPSVMSIHSNPLYPWAFRNSSGSFHGTESELDGVRYSREGDRSSPALPDSVRTSVLSYFERR